MAVAFKEWASVCEALGRGEQDVIIRKGGIHEGREGFQFEHERFYLFPTLFHKQVGQVKELARHWAPDSEKKVYEVGELVEIRYCCRVLRVEALRDWEQVMALDGRHVYAESLVRERFEWEGKGMLAGAINVAYVETEELATPLVVEYKKSHGGCRSWVEV
ncbi:DUF1802 family protein [Rubritalea tangerina]|uniref:DUF1802 family protein n=1 Tax=Rubritalea tangerina TaxID=430798 RepID=A0ABW4ZA91_9BACT